MHVRMMLETEIVNITDKIIRIKCADYDKTGQYYEFNPKKNIPRLFYTEPYLIGSFGMYQPIENFENQELELDFSKVSEDDPNSISIFRMPVNKLFYDKDNIQNIPRTDPGIWYIVDSTFKYNGDQSILSHALLVANPKDEDGIVYGDNLILWS